MFNILCRFISSKNYDVYIMSFPIFIIYLFYNVVCFILYLSYNISWHWVHTIMLILICAFYKEKKILLKCELSKYNKRVIIRYTFINGKSDHKNHDSSDDDDGHRCNQQRAKCNSWQIKNGLCFSKGTFPIAKQFIQRIAGWQNLIFKLALDDRFMFIC